MWGVWKLLASQDQKEESEKQEEEKAECKAKCCPANLLQTPWKCAYQGFSCSNVG